MTRAGRAGLLALLVAAPLAPAALAQEGPLGIAVVDQPRTADPRSERYIVGTVAPGERLRRTVRLTSSGPMPVTLYPGAAAVEAGVFVFADGRATNELTAWTRVLPPEVVVDGSRTVEVTVDVPDSAPPGERHAVVWAEVTTTPGPEGVRLVSRVGVRMHVAVQEQRGGAVPLPLVLGAAALVLLTGAATRLAVQNRP